MKSLFAALAFTTLASLAAADGLEDLTSCCSSKICSFPYNGYGYFLSPSRSWYHARLFCQGLGGDLATIGVRSLSMRQSIMEFVSAPDEVWIGASDVEREGCFKWVDGYKASECAVFTLFWEDDQPNNDGDEDCVDAEADDGWRAHDLDCNNVQMHGLCEIPLRQCSASCDQCYRSLL